MAVSERVLQRVVAGSCPFEELPPLSKRVVRIFISSTFSDTKEERNALMERVYPRLAELCREKYGLEFQVVDMRWGVPEQASDNHTTTELCLQEIKRCQEVSIGPNFVAILGNKYGYRPIPTVIPGSEFSTLAEMAQSAKDRRWHVVSEWYRKDDNSCPTVFVLQPISAKLEHYSNTENQELRKKAQTEWNETNVTLTNVLREVSTKARELGKITEEERLKYFMSVTENEVHHGISHPKTDLTETTLCIVREIPDVNSHLKHPKACKFIDIEPSTSQVDMDAARFLQELKNRVPLKVPESNMTKVDIEWSASGASLSLENVDSVDVVGVAKFADRFLKRSTSLSQHKDYLDIVCSQFLEKISRMVTEAGTRQEKLYDQQVNEVIQHWHFAKLRCEVFEGREDILAGIADYVSGDSQTPLMISGNSGCGKTSVMAKAAHVLLEQLEQSSAGAALGDKQTFTILRFLGTTPMTSNVQILLVSLCQQLCKLCSKEWKEPEKFSNLIKEFHTLLAECSETHRLVFIIDSVDQLMPAYGAYKMNWLPQELPTGVKMIVSTLDEGYDILQVLRQKYEAVDGRFMEIKPLEQDVGMTIINKWLEKGKRRITDEQKGIVLKALDACGLPLYARIMFDHVRRWKSFDTPTFEELQTTVKGVINKLFDQMEAKFGASLVKHSLAYLTASRHGLSEVELENILSLDDQVLNKVFSFWKPPIRRVPPLLWTRVRTEINSYIVERSADGLLVLSWYHRQFIAATKERYLADKDFSRFISQTLCDYFLGKWGGGRRKPFQYTEGQKKRFNLESNKAEADRKVPSQPYIIEGRCESEKTTRFNQRKLSELPMHLLKSDQKALLRSEIFFNFEWILAKLMSTSAQALLQEYEVFMMADKELRKDTEMKILYTTLQLIRPYLLKYPNSLPMELSGRLAKYVGVQDSITNLVKQCDSVGILYCPLVPVFTCFESAQLGLKQNINIRKSDPWEPDGGALVCKSDFKTMYVIDCDDCGISHLTAWDIESGEQFQSHQIAKPRDSATFDVYFQAYFHESEKYIIAAYRKKFYEGLHRKRYNGHGYVDLINVDDGSVLKTLDGYLYGRGFNNAVFYMTANWVALRFGAKLPIMHLFEDKMKMLTHPHLLSKDETKFLMTKRSRKAAVKYYVGDDQKVAASRTKMAVIREFQNKEHICELGSDCSMDAAVFTSDQAFAILGNLMGTIMIYDVSKLSQGKVMKAKRVITLPRTERCTVKDSMVASQEADDSEDEEAMESDEKISLRLKLILSPDEQMVVSCHQGPDYWEAFLWNVGKGQFLAKIASRRPLTAKYPSFSYDSQHVVLPKEDKLALLSAADPTVIKEYELSSVMRDFCVSRSTGQVAVLLTREVVLLDTEDKEQATGQKQKKKPKKRVNQKSASSDPQIIDTLLPREQIANTQVLNEIELNETTAGLVAEEVECSAEADITVMLPDGQSKLKVALDTWVTPDGSKQVELYSKTQIVDTAAEEIKYTPNVGDTIHKSAMGSSLTPSTAPESKTHQNGPIAIMETMALGPMDLSMGDRIMGENGKTKFRIMSANKIRLRVLDTPSVFTVYSIDGGSKRRLLDITVFQESIQAVSNEYIATVKKKQAGDYVNVYSLGSGRLLTTHEVGGAFGCLRISLDQTRIYVARRDLSLTVFSGTNFMSALAKMDKFADARKDHMVRDIRTFPYNEDVVLMQFSEEGVAGYNTNHYYHADLVANTLSKQMTLMTPFEDLAKDGSIGIDSQLNVYDLPSGKVLHQITHVNIGVNAQLQVRLSEDNRYVVAIDKEDDTLHVFKMIGKSVHHVTSCFTHAPNLLPYGGFGLRQFGRVISVQGPQLELMAIRDPDTTIGNKVLYGSERVRAMSLIPRKAPFRRTQMSIPRKGGVLAPIRREYGADLASQKPTVAKSEVIVEDFLATLNENTLKSPQS